MRTGMLWFDNDPKTDLPTKVLRAAAYYQKKYGCSPNLCFVHPTMIKPEGPRASGNRDAPQPPGAAQSPLAGVNEMPSS